MSRGLTTKLISSTTTVVACAVLHNLSLMYNDALPEDDEVDEQIDVPVQPAPDIQAVDGFATRETLIARLFN